MIECEWTGIEKVSTVNASTSPTDVLRVFFFFRTFIRGEDWQVRRELYCVTLSMDAVKTLNSLLKTRLMVNPCRPASSSQFTTIRQRLLRLRNLLGSEALQYAMNNVSLSLSFDMDEVQWNLPPAKGWIVGRAASALYQKFHEVAQTARLSSSKLDLSLEPLPWIQQHQVERSDTEPLPKTFKSLDNEGGAILVIKPVSSPQLIPKFCLFVLEKGHVDDACMRQWLLHSFHHVQLMNADPGTAITFSSDDRHIIKSWLASLHTGG